MVKQASEQGPSIVFYDHKYYCQNGITIISLNIFPLSVHNLYNVCGVFPCVSYCLTPATTQSKIFLGRFSDYDGQAFDITSGFCGTAPLIIVGPWLAYVAFIEGNFLQCGPQYIAVFGGTIPLLVRIMWALPMRYQGHFPQYTQDIIMEFLLKIHYYF